MPVLDLASLPNDLATAVKFGAAHATRTWRRWRPCAPAPSPGRAGARRRRRASRRSPSCGPSSTWRKLQNQVVGYVTVERDGPVPGAAYMRNIVVKPELRRKGLGAVLLNHALQVARDMYRKTLALRVDPANAPAVSFYRKAGFTTVATVVSKKSGKLRLLMSREL